MRSSMSTRGLERSRRASPTTVLAAQRQTQPGAPLEDSRIRQPTVIAWGELDPVILAAWADRLGETFLDHELSLLPGIGHFVPIEAPEQTIETIRRSLALARQHERRGGGRS
jgi:pimeloyl-ACP methyl ester carboxylesterase